MAARAPPQPEKPDEPERTRGSAASLLRAFRHPLFRMIWFASLVANIGGWMYNAAAGWLMTSLDSSPFMVSLVQVANSLPMFLFALPAGALADIFDKRRLILVLEISIAVISALFAALVSAGLVIPATLLLFLFLIGSLSALEAPAWQAVVPHLVPAEDLGAAVAANSVGINISRAIGPALAGVVIAGWGIAAPFWFDAISNFGVIGVFLWWRSQRRPAPSLPAERVTSAIRIGFRHVRNNRHLRATLIRSVGFFLFASAYWALLPLIARAQIGGSPEIYGILLGAIGAGAVAGAFALPKLKARLGANGLLALAEVGTAVSLLLFALSHEPIMATCASVIAGASWIAALGNLNVSAQIALPDWVRGRGLAMFVMVFFGTVTVGSAAWGAVAGVAGLPLALMIAAAGALAAVPLTARWKLQTATGIDLSPSMHWPAPVVTEVVESDAGPVMVTVEYRVEPEHRDAFLFAIHALSAERKRDGAYAWGIFSDSADKNRLVETFFLESWMEHLRQHQRVTNADRVQQQRIRHLLREPPRVTHFVAAD
jgi:predicted MFS family arabinose efflux permease/quinol monooxygenase YgiN